MSSLSTMVLVAAASLCTCACRGRDSGLSPMPDCVGAQDASVPGDAGRPRREDGGAPQDGGSGLDAAEVDPAPADTTGDETGRAPDAQFDTSEIECLDVADPADGSVGEDSGPDIAYDLPDNPAPDAYPAAPPSHILAYADLTDDLVSAVTKDGEVVPILSCVSPCGLAPGGEATLYVAGGHGFISIGANIYEVPFDPSAGVISEDDIAPLWTGYGMFFAMQGLVSSGASLFVGRPHCTGSTKEGDLSPAVLELSLESGLMTVAAELECEFQNRGLALAGDGSLLLGDLDIVNKVYGADGLPVSEDYDNVVWRQQPGGAMVKWLDDFEFEPEGVIMDIAAHPTTLALHVLVGSDIGGPSTHVRVYDVEGTLVDMSPILPRSTGITVAKSGDVYLLGWNGPILHIAPDGDITQIPGTQVGGAGGITVME